MFLIKLIVFAYLLSLIYGAATGQMEGVARMHQVWVQGIKRVLAAIVELANRVIAMFSNTTNKP
jgi:hypothetical protein